MGICIFKAANGDKRCSLRYTQDDRGVETEQKEERAHLSPFTSALALFLSLLAVKKRMTAYPSILKDASFYLLPALPGSQVLVLRIVFFLTQPVGKDHKITKTNCF